ncbi:MAG: C_GCAxxG_C_C family protein [Deltaproteobacteria bacterium]|nr:C_GCAxxG_C_C family protein [Deltaproteobacteria bacterium]
MDAHQSKEEFLKQLGQKAGDYEELLANCAQGTLLALQEKFDLGNAQTLKAATAMSGIALRGETCGSVIGSIMALGMFFGCDNPGDFTASRRVIRASRKFCRQFEAIFGSCNCRDIQQRIFGRSFNLANSNDMEAFTRADAGKKCRLAVEKAAKIAGEIILESNK